MSLHIVSKSPFSSTALADCLTSFIEGDALVLIEDGVYALSGALKSQPVVGPVYCLAADAQARGLTIPAAVEAIDDDRWASLCTEHNPIVSWFR
ncbi:sulfurtransferase complex subunit TusB [Microbulbifer sediminum]|uniref:sulfurtransferase complex subunit TusB n=1 Tax=Microbulbifer sediminum TaxID=2904250 RepID=UPI001F029F9E|nr:sulfurtransferase complex subunit TusB [Microbulbifer sediminum]